MKIVSMPKRKGKIIPVKNSCIIFIKDPDENHLSGYWENSLTIECENYDIEKTESIDKQIFNEVDAKKIIDFVKILEPDINTIYVYCRIDSGRSVAVSKFLGEMFDTEEVKFCVKSSPHMYVYNTLKKVYEGDV